jgi:alkaline phosphatase
MPAIRPAVATAAVVALLTMPAAAQMPASPTGTPSTGNVVFFHPDGSSISHWGALRLHTKGPDGTLAWDELPHMALYKGHMKDALAGTSHGGATVHAYGVKVAADSFGLDRDQPITAASGKPASIMREAMAAGRAVGVVQTGHLAEPGSAAFLASSVARNDYAGIAEQVVRSGAQVILGGGEELLLPVGVAGRHGPGKRTDGLDLVAWAKASGYTVVYTREELRAVDPATTPKLLGLFAANDTYNDDTEEKNAAAGLPHYLPTAPTVAEMAAAALTILSRAPGGFFLVVEEEGVDNFGNMNNAAGALEALRRADEAVAVLHAHVKANPDTLLIMAADSDAGGMQVVGPGPGKAMVPGQPLPERSKNGAPADGVTGTASAPFMSAPDAKFQRWPFAVVWATENDVAGAILVRAAGRNAELVRGRVDNTDVYKIMYRTLFGVTLP